MSSFLLLFIIVYLAIRVLSLLWPKIASLLLVIITTVYCFKEELVGLFQLLGYQKSNHFYYAVTGTFFNPGPYGGFLSICICLLVAFCVKNIESYKRNGLYRILFWIIAIIAAFAFIFLLFTQSRSAIIALGCSIVLLALGTEQISVKIKPFLKEYGLSLAIIIATLGVGAYLIKKPSADGRLFMDKICVKSICQKGWKGVGYGHFGGAYGETQANYFKKQIDIKGKDDLDWIVINEHDRLTADCPDNAFNEYLFIGVEEGPIVMLLFIVIIVSTIIVSYKRGTIWCYGLTAFAVFALFSYPLHIKQFKIILPILLAACVSVPNNTNKKNKMVTLFAMLVVFSLLFVLNLPKARLYQQTEKSWNQAELWYRMGQYEYAVEDCEKLFPYLQNDFKFLFAYGQSLNKIGEYEKSDSILKMGTEISSDPMFWNVMGNNSLALGRYREAEERYKHAFYMVPNRLYPLNLLAKLYYAEGDTARFLDMADRVETFIPKVESVSTAQLRDEIRQLKASIILKQKQ